MKDLLTFPQISNSVKRFISGIIIQISNGEIVYLEYTNWKQFLKGKFLTYSKLLKE